MHSMQSLQYVTDTIGRECLMRPCVRVNDPVTISLEYARELYYKVVPAVR